MTYLSDSYEDPIAAFGDALRDAGFRLRGHPIMDGHYHRCVVEGDKGRKQSGRYRGYLDGNPAGFIQNFKDESRTTKWVFKADKPAQSAEERETARRLIDA